VKAQAPPGDASPPSRAPGGTSEGASLSHCEAPPAPLLPRVLLFVRAPTLGRVKTRLARGVPGVEGVGDAKALEIYRALGRGVALRLGEGTAPGGEEGAEATPGWALEVHVAPDPEGADPLETTRAWLAGCQVRRWVLQEGETLGDRMRHALRGALEAGAPAACVVASDVPELGARHAGEAFRALGVPVRDAEARVRHAGVRMRDARVEARGRPWADPPPCDLVLGPSPDGGYYLLGVRRTASPSGWDPRQDGLFAGIPWSTDQVSSLTLQRAEAAGLQYRTLEPLADVDDAGMIKGRRG
jgi:glycosyltransferase A (GT-A) superfamily protein (DUF2064 family)